MRDSGDFVGKIILYWDPAKELGNYFPLTVWKGNPGVQGTQILRFRVHIVETPPALFVPFSGNDNVVGNVELSVQPGKRDHSGLDRRRKKNEEQALISCPSGYSITPITWGNLLGIAIF